MTLQRALTTYGAGRLYATRQDVANGTPLEFGVLQGVDRELSFTTKAIYGTNQWPVFVARGEAKWTMKAKVGIMSGLLVNSLFLGQSLAAGQLALANGIAGTVPTMSTYTITPTVPNSGTFAADQGVVYAATGIPLVEVASVSAAGQYSQSGGVYTFDSADASAAVLMSFTYTYSTAGQKVAIAQQEMGTTPYFSAVFRGRDPRSGIFETLVLNRCTSSKLALSSKTSDYQIPEMDIEAMDDGTGNIGTYSFGDLS